MQVTRTPLDFEANNFKGLTFIAISAEKQRLLCIIMTTTGAAEINLTAYKMTYSGARHVKVELEEYAGQFNMQGF